MQLVMPGRSAGCAVHKEIAGYTVELTDGLRGMIERLGQAGGMGGVKREGVVGHKNRGGKDRSDRSGA
jgi:hypothetical protein